MTDSTPGSTATPAQPAGAELILQQIYLKDCSYEAPNGPRIPAAQWNPKFALNLNTTSTELSPELREVVLTVTVEAKVGDNVAYIVELKQAGLFVIRNCSPEDLKKVIGSVCPGVLFPYARAACSELITQGGFPQFLLPPVNFDALFERAVPTAQAPSN
ncbi:MAG TPA: protein-export chaperone SecB [Steroidobacteraceae bacterium]|nr:protein-export chaperone SecB [Steroidobacteraceae bacterium]